MRRPTIVFLRIVALSFIAALSITEPASAAQDKPPSTVSAEQARALGVRFAPLGPARSASLDGLAAEVTVSPDRMHLVSAAVAALVERVMVAPGDRVRRGQLLASLASPDLAHARRALLQAQAQAELAESTLARDRELLEAGVIARSRMEAALAQARETRAALTEARQLLAMAGLNDSSIAALLRGAAVPLGLELHAPVDGVVIAREVVPGQRVEPMTALFRIARTDRLALLIHVPRDRIAQVQAGRMVRVGDRAAGVVEMVGASVDPQSQTVPVRVALAEDAGGLRIGEFVQASVQIPLPAGARAFSVPNAALVRAAGAVHLFIEEREQVRAVRVELLHTGFADSQVAASLPDGTRIVVTGNAALKAALLGGGDL